MAITKTEQRILDILANDGVSYLTSQLARQMLYVNKESPPRAAGYFKESVTFAVKPQHDSRYDFNAKESSTIGHLW